MRTPARPGPASGAGCAAHAICQERED